MQATAYTFDPATRSGSVLLDDGSPVPFGAAAFDAGGLRLLRPGQRVRIETAPPEADASGGPDQVDSGAVAGSAARITLITLQTF